MRIAFVGAVESSAVLLAATLRAGGDVVAVGTLPPDVGRARHSDYVDLAPLAAAAGIAVHDLSDPGGLATMVSTVRPDVLFVFGWSRLVPAELLARVPMGGIGFHPAPLPIGRGRHPLIWSIVLGLRESAISFMLLRAEADAGPIVLQRRFAIAVDETARGLMDRVLEAGDAAVPDLLSVLTRDGIAAAVPQDDARAVVWRKRGRGDGRIDFRMPRQAIDRLVRALSAPYPGAEAIHAEVGDIQVHRVVVPGDEAVPGPIEPGRVVGLRDGCPVVAAADGLVVLTDYAADGGSRPNIAPGSWFC